MNTSSLTTVTGAALGSAVGCIVVYLLETLARTDVPTAVEGAILVVVTALVALVYPAPPRA